MKFLSVLNYLTCVSYFVQRWFLHVFICMICVHPQGTVSTITIIKSNSTVIVFAHNFRWNDHVFFCVKIGSSSLYFGRMLSAVRSTYVGSLWTQFDAPHTVQSFRCQNPRITLWSYQNVHWHRQEVRWDEFHCNQETGDWENSVNRMLIKLIKTKSENNISGGSITS